MGDRSRSCVPVTGIAGFIGSHLVRPLAWENGVAILDNLESGPHNRIPWVPFLAIYAATPLERAASMTLRLARPRPRENA